MVKGENKACLSNSLSNLERFGVRVDYVSDNQVGLTDFTNKQKKSITVVTISVKI